MDRPVLFSGEMVRAILAGKKTQTRRVVKPQPPEGRAPIYMTEQPQTWLAPMLATKSPYFIGDRLWVRETHRPVYCSDMADGIQYRADGQVCVANVENRADGCQHHRMNQAFHWNACIEEGWDDETQSNNQKWMPSIHMPRWASRITLEVTGVRAERLQDITEDDAKAEGLEPYADFVDDIPSCKTGFMLTWERLYGFDAWIANPWVWVIEFRGAGE